MSSGMNPRLGIDAWHHKHPSPSEITYAAVKREVLEEAGLSFHPLNVLHIDCASDIIYIYYYGHVSSGTLKSHADAESLAASWLPISILLDAERKRSFGKPPSPQSFTLRSPIMSIVMRAQAYRKRASVEYRILPRTDSSLDSLLSTCKVRLVIVRRDENFVIFHRDKLPTLPARLHSLYPVIRHFVDPMRRLLGHVRDFD
ncbi:hypothetical protein Ciccas_000153 [Cichlidogyrus casuarinus]|uniref:Nudix hydrolase domain-containing protein n=1 Tax=Cichlidogyrus casuarinus TaxID=1844966 RepID=A0ABD2QNQ8_9PLAT